MARNKRCDILIVGGGVGGCAAALAACEMGKCVIMTEPTKWIGGQLTQQAIPPDENRAIEYYGATLRYRTFRDRVREYYKNHYPLSYDAQRAPFLNPGNGYVSKLCHEFTVGLAVLNSMLGPYRAAGRLEVLFRTEPTAAQVDRDRIESVSFRNTESGSEFTIEADFVLDATEEGDLLPLAEAEYVVGFESKDMTGEPSARDEYEPLNQQAISWCFALEYRESERHVIDKPAQYDFWRSYVPPLDPPWCGPFLSWQTQDPQTLELRNNTLFNKPDGTEDEWSLWRFRRIVDRTNFRPGFFFGDVSLINWPQIDYVEGPIIDVGPEDRQKHLQGAQQQSLSFLYWMQTEAPWSDNPDRCGYPGLKLRGDMTGDASHGLALYPYIRESRRIKAEFTVLEQHVARAIRGDKGAELFADSVGIGHYNIDLHPSTGGDNYIDRPCCPFQIPLGALIPVRLENLLPAGKNLGVTHITNGCYRLHPVEWNIGEAAGALAGHCLNIDETPRGLRNTPKRLEFFQDLLRRQGVLTQWHRAYTEATMR